MHIEVVPERPTDAQLRRLRAHVPYSLPLLRRLQTAAGAFDHGSDSTDGGTSPYAEVVFVSEGPLKDEGDENGTPFAAGYVDLSKAPETLAWVYSSDEDSGWPVPPPNDEDNGPDPDRLALVADWSSERRRRCRRLMLGLLRHIRSRAAALAPTVPSVAEYATDRVKIAVHAGVGALLRGVVVDEDLALPIVTSETWFPYDKWLFRIQDIPVLPQDQNNSDNDTLTVSGFEGPFRWDVVKKDDVPSVVSRTHIPRTEATLLFVPSVGLRGPDGTLVAWAFLGFDGTIWTLHCEPPYRGRGLAKAVAARLMRRHNGVFGDDGWCVADVSASNLQSQGVCRSLGGKRAWASAWTVVHYDSFGGEA